jgi:hypothetical protein
VSDGKITTAGHHPRESRSAVDALCQHVVDVVRATGDVKNLKAWAEITNKSVSSLRTLCYTVRVRPRQALQFARALRAIVNAPSAESWDLAEWIVAAEPKTLARMAKVAGVPVVAERPPSVHEFLVRQSVLASHSPLVRGVRSLILDPPE